MGNSQNKEPKTFVVKRGTRFDFRRRGTWVVAHIDKVLVKNKLIIISFADGKSAVEVDISDETTRKRIAPLGRFTKSPTSPPKSVSKSTKRLFNLPPRPSITGAKDKDGKATVGENGGTRARSRSRRDNKRNSSSSTKSSSNQTSGNPPTNKSSKTHKRSNTLKKKRPSRKETPRKEGGFVEGDLEGRLSRGLPLEGSVGGGMQSTVPVAVMDTSGDAPSLPTATTLDATPRGNRGLVRFKFEIKDIGPVGIVLKRTNEEDYVFVAMIRENSQAATCDLLEKGDLVVSVNDVPCYRKRVTEVAGMMVDKPCVVEFEKRSTGSDDNKNHAQIFKPKNGVIRFDYLFDDPEPPTPNSDPGEPPIGGCRWRPAEVVSKTWTRGGAVQFELEFLDDVGGGLHVTKPTSNFSSFHDFQTYSTGQYFHHQYHPGDVIDVKHQFPYEVVGNVPMMWYKAQILRVTQYYILVHFVGFDREHDQWMHGHSDRHLFAPFGSETDKQQVKYMQRESQFKEMLKKKKKLDLHEVKSDGNCLFRAVAYQVLGDEDLHDDIRQSCCDYMEKYKDRFAYLVPDGKFNEYVEHMRQEKVWGDDPEIRAIEEQYDRPIEIYACDQAASLESCLEPMKLHFEGDLPPKIAKGGVESIKLSYHGQNHYNAITPVGAKLPMIKRGTDEIRLHRSKNCEEAKIAMLVQKRSLLRRSVITPVQYGEVVALADVEEEDTQVV